MAGLLNPHRGRSDRTRYRVQPSAGGRSEWLALLRRTLSFPIPIRFIPAHSDPFSSPKLYDAHCGAHRRGDCVARAGRFASGEAGPNACDVNSTRRVMTTIAVPVFRQLRCCYTEVVQRRLFSDAKAPFWIPLPVIVNGSNVTLTVVRSRA